MEEDVLPPWISIPPGAKGETTPKMSFGWNGPYQAVVMGLFVKNILSRPPPPRRLAVRPGQR